MDRAPHFLRVVQALALVSGFGAVTIAAAVTVDGCHSADATDGAICAPDGCNYDGGVDRGQDAGRVGSFDGGGIAFDPGIDAGPEFLDVWSGICADDGSIAPDASDGMADAAVADGGTDEGGDATTDGGPLPPPDLPA